MRAVLFGGSVVSLRALCCAAVCVSVSVRDCSDSVSSRSAENGHALPVSLPPSLLCGGAADESWRRRSVCMRNAETEGLSARTDDVGFSASDGG